MVEYQVNFRKRAGISLLSSHERHDATNHRQLMTTSSLRISQSSPPFYCGIPSPSTTTCFFILHLASDLLPVCHQPTTHYLIWTGRPRMPWWRHQMETFSALLAFRAGNSPVTREFPSQRPVTRSFDVFFDCAWWIETTSRSLWRHYNAQNKKNRHICWTLLWIKGMELWTWQLSTHTAVVKHPGRWFLFTCAEYRMRTRKR